MRDGLYRTEVQAGIEPSIGGGELIEVVAKFFWSSGFLCGQCASVAVLDLVADQGKTDRAATATIDFVTAFCRAFQSLVFRRGEAVGDGRWVNERKSASRAWETDKIQKKRKAARANWTRNARGVQHCM